MNQKEGVYTVIKSVCEKNGVEIVNGVNEEGKANWQELITKDMKSEIEMAVSVALHEGHISMTEKSRVKYNSVEVLLSDYVPGLVKNWLRKDTRLNGGVEHQIKNPGSRSDSVIKNLKLILKNPGLSDEQRSQVEAQIKKRQAEIAVKSAPVIDFSVLQGLDGFNVSDFVEE